MELPIINQSYEVYKTLVELNSHLTRRWAYSLGENAEKTILDLLEELIMAREAPKPMKANYLSKANAKLEIARLKLRVYLELNLVNETKIFQLQTKLAEIGRMLGGWLKASHTQ